MKIARLAVVGAVTSALVTIGSVASVAQEPLVEPADAVVVVPANPGVFTAGASLAPGRLVWGEDADAGPATLRQREVTQTSPLSLSTTTEVLGTSQYPDVVGDGRRTVFQGNGAGLIAYDGATTSVVDVVDTSSQPMRMSGHRVAEAGVGAFLFDGATGGWDFYPENYLVHWGAVGAIAALRPDVHQSNYIDRIDLDTKVRTRWFTAQQAGLSADELLRPVGMSSEIIVFERSLLTGEQLGLGWYNWRTGGHGLVPSSINVSSNLSVYSTFVTVHDRGVSPTWQHRSSVYDTSTGQRVLDLPGSYFMAVGSSGMYWSSWSTGEAKVASLPGARAPIHEGNPIAAKTFAPVVGRPWTAEFAFTEPLETCSVEVSNLAGVLQKALPCDSRWTKYGEASVAWDGRTADGSPSPKGVYRWSIKATGAGGAALASPGSGALSGTVTIEDHNYVALTPVRVFDTRSGLLPAREMDVPGGSLTEIKVAGAGAVPATATTVVLNVTIASPRHQGYATVYPTGTPRPTSSNVNYSPAGGTTANQVVAKVGAHGRVSIFLSEQLQSFGGILIVDVAGYYATTSKVVTTTPSRLLDTRQTVRLKAGAKIDVQIAGRAGIPANGAVAAVLNVTALGGTAPSGYLTVWPAGAARPVASNLNYRYGAAQPALAIARLGAAGKVSIYSSATTDVLVDVTGWLPVTSDIKPLTPARVLDTRLGLGAPKAPVGPGRVVSLQITGRGGVPITGVKAVVLNVTAATSTRPGYLSVYPAGAARPNASVVNYAPGRAVANSVVAKVGSGGKVNVYSNTGGHVVVDVQGYVTN